MIDHEHRFFLSTTKKEFEYDHTEAGVDFYVMTEYAWLGCNCGEVIKTKVKKQED